MAIIKLQSFNSKIKSGNNYTPDSTLNKCVDLLDIQNKLLRDISEYARGILREHCFDADLFFMEEESARDYLAINMMDFVDGSTEIYVAFSDKTGCSMEVSVQCADGERVEYDYCIFRNINKKSEVYDEAIGEWVECPPDV